MKISILTPSYNQADFIEKPIKSVMNQDWGNVEHIIIDGGSTDNTVDILKKYSHLKWISEPDEGQADALNKGLAMASGDIIGWINSDDYYEKNIFKDVISEFKNKTVKWVIGNIVCIYPSYQISDPIKSPEITYNRLLANPDIVKQQAVFFRKSALIKAGAWNKKYYMTMDYDLWLRLSKKYTPKMIDKTWAYFTHHEDQKSTPQNALTQINNIKGILHREKAPKIFICKILTKKYYYYFKSFFKSFLLKTKIIDSKYQNIPISIVKNNSRKTNR